MAQTTEGEKASEARAEELWRELFGLVRDERAVRREIGNRVLNAQPVDELRMRRRELRESQEDLSAAVMQLEAAGP